MKPGFRFVLVLFLVFVMLAFLSACSQEEKCPSDGKWVTGQTGGVINFTTSYCTVDSLVVSFEIGNGTTATQIFEPNCTLSGSAMTCEQSGMEFKAKFDEDGNASGTVVIPKGLELNTGGNLEKSVSLKWAASLK